MRQKFDPNKPETYTWPQYPSEVTMGSASPTFDGSLPPRPTLPADKPKPKKKTVPGHDSNANKILATHRKNMGLK